MSPNVLKFRVEDNADWPGVRIWPFGAMRAEITVLKPEYHDGVAVITWPSIGPMDADHTEAFGKALIEAAQLARVLQAKWDEEH